MQQKSSYAYYKLFIQWPIVVYRTMYFHVKNNFSYSFLYENNLCEKQWFYENMIYCVKQIVDAFPFVDKVERI